MLSELEKKDARLLINKHQHEIYILSLDEMDFLVSNKVKGNILKQGWGKLKSNVELSTNYYATGKDVVLLGKLMGDLGHAGTKTYIKYYGGKAHFVLKGYPGLRNILTGTKYGIQNAKVIQMGMGKYGAVQAAKSGGVLTIVLVSAFRVIDYFLTDSATLNQLIGTLATDVVKIGLATSASIVAASATATLAASTGILIAFGPLAVAIVVGVGAAMLLEAVDDKYKITDKIIMALDEIQEKGIKVIIDEKKQGLINKSEALANDVVESVIDYAVETTQDALRNIVTNLFRSLSLPRLL